MKAQVIAGLQSIAKVKELAVARKLAIKRHKEAVADRASKALMQNLNDMVTQAATKCTCENPSKFGHECCEERAKAVLDVFQSKLIKRGISLKSLETGDPVAGGKEYRITSTLKEGISQENAKKIGKLIRDEGPKSVKSQIQGDELRVQSKSRDDLQTVQRMLKEADLDVDLQFVNYR